MYITWKDVLAEDIQEQGKVMALESESDEANGVEREDGRKGEVQREERKEIYIYIYIYIGERERRERRERESREWNDHN